MGNEVPFEVNGGMKIAYLDCFSGISGDMLLGALLDAGLDFEVLRKALGSLPLEGYTLEKKREERGGLFGTLFLVRVERERQEHRGLKDIAKIIRAGGLSKEVQDRSIQIFESIAQEEGKIHNRPADEVHFHEVGAVDSIMDIVGSVFGIEYLGIASLFVSSLPLGSGFVETQHGRIPIPAPATIALLKGIPVYDSGLEHELVTPTGAALVNGLASSVGSMPAMTIDRVGYGVGSRTLPDRPNLLRIIMGRDQTEKQVDTVVTLEANLDDTNPEWLGFLMGRLFEAGALDVAFCPIQMKKNRPGILVQVIGKPELKDTLMDVLFRESTTLGIRFHYSQRKVLPRSEAEVESPWGRMRVKEVLRPDGTSYFLPEYEACREIAEQKKIPIREVYDWVASLNKT
jgi:uncharacterized protein (TIGR00299 family) protein